MFWRWGGAEVIASSSCERLVEEVKLILILFFWFCINVYKFLSLRGQGFWKA